MFEPALSRIKFSSMSCWVFRFHVPLAPLVSSVKSMTFLSSPSSSLTMSMDVAAWWCRSSFVETFMWRLLWLLSYDCLVHHTPIFRITMWGSFFSSAVVFFHTKIAQSDGEKGCGNAERDIIASSRTHSKEGTEARESYTTGICLNHHGHPWSSMS